MRPLFATSILSLIILISFGCKTKSESVEPSPLGEPFEVPVWNYALNHFFIDTPYISTYNKLMQIPPVVEHPEYQILWIQVWKNRHGAVDPSREFPVRAFITLPPVDSAIYESMRSPFYSIQDSVEAGKFVPLEPADYSYDAFAGTLAILDPTVIADDHAIAVSYLRADGCQFGETLSMVRHDSVQQTMILKLVRPSNFGITGTTAWRLMMKNIYSIGKIEIAHTGFSLDVFRNDINGNQINSILGISLLKILGVDKIQVDGTSGSDGTFDFLPGITIDKIHGEIIFPNVHPFDDGIREYFTSIGQPLSSTSDYPYPALYDTTRGSLMQIEIPPYVIKGRAVI